MKQIDRYYFYDETLISPEAIMVEVGAFSADRAAWWRQEYPRGRVWLVECEPVNFAELRAATARMSGVHIAEVALAPKDGPVHLYRYHNRHCHSLIDRDLPEARGQIDSIGVGGMTLETLLDTIRLDRIDLLLLNIEGGELWVAEELSVNIDVRRRVPQICTALHPQIYGSSDVTRMQGLIVKDYSITPGTADIPYDLWRLRQCGQSTTR